MPAGRPPGSLGAVTDETGKAETQAQFLRRYVKTVGRLVYKELPRVEAQRRAVIDQMVDVRARIGVAEKESYTDVADEILGDLAKMSRKVQKSWRAIVPDQPAMQAVHAGMITSGAWANITFESASWYWAGALEELPMKLQYRAIRSLFADSLMRLGTFYVGKFGYAMLSAAPLAITFSGDALWNRISVLALELEDSEAFLQHFETVIYDILRQLAEYYVEELRIKMAIVPIPTRGGTYSAPITASGRLAAALGILDEGVVSQENQRRFFRAGAARTISIGIKDSHVPDSQGGDPKVYGEILGSALGSGPPAWAVGRVNAWWSEEQTLRWEAWAAIRGIPKKPNLRRIMASVLRLGTYGRAWLAYLVGGTRIIPNMGMLNMQLAEAVEEYLYGD